MCYRYFACVCLSSLHCVPSPCRARRDGTELQTGAHSTKQPKQPQDTYIYTVGFNSQNQDRPSLLSEEVASTLEI